MSDNVQIQREKIRIQKHNSEDQTSVIFFSEWVNIGYQVKILLSSKRIPGIKGLFNIGPGSAEIP